MFGQTVTRNTQKSTGRPCYKCLMLWVLLVLGLSYAVANPVIFINGGGEEVDPTLMDCSQQTPEYDSETGLTSYRCKEVLKDAVANTEDSDETNDTISETMIVKSDLEDDKDEVKYEDVKSGSSKRRRKNRKNRKPKNTRKNKNYHFYDRMISDAPMNDSSDLKKSKNDVKPGKVFRVGKFDINNHCASGELYISELHICLPHDNTLNNFNIYDRPQADALTLDSKYNKNEKKRPMQVGKFLGKSHCGSGEVYVSELDICLPHDNKLVQFSIYDRPQGDMPVVERYESIESDENEESVLSLQSNPIYNKNRCGPGEIYLSELDICLPHKS